MRKEHLDICIESGADDLQPPAPKHTACVQSTVEILLNHGVKKPLQLRTQLCLCERDHTMVIGHLSGRYVVGGAQNLRRTRGEFLEPPLLFWCLLGKIISVFNPKMLF